MELTVQKEQLGQLDQQEQMELTVQKEQLVQQDLQDQLDRKETLL
jgi:hypothetical protein